MVCSSDFDRLRGRQAGDLTHDPGLATRFVIAIVRRILGLEDGPVQADALRSAVNRLARQCADVVAALHLTC